MARLKVYVATEPVDLRKGFDTLAAATREIIGRDPLSGHAFVFVNRRRHRLKLLLWEPNGYVLVYKRLEKGKFYLPLGPRLGERHIELEAAEFMLMLEGIDLRGAQRRERWSPANNCLHSRDRCDIKRT